LGADENVYILNLDLDMENEENVNVKIEKMMKMSVAQLSNKKSSSVVGLGVKYSPATRMSRVRVPDDA
jgi:hypothetical protein